MALLLVTLEEARMDLQMEELLGEVETFVWIYSMHNLIQLHCLHLG
jgi:hypothetical protein